MLEWYRIAIVKDTFSVLLHLVFVLEHIKLSLCF